jgi:pimeloyl-ACP methyl ester carboxylesterase
MITGHSQGNPHAMAAAYHFGQRCVGLGLNAPLLPADITKELGLKGALGMDSLFMTHTLKRFYMAWYFGVFYLMLDLLSPFIPMIGIRQTCPALAKDDAYLKIARATLKRANIRGTIGNTWESAKDVCFDWGFELRLIETKNICVWHAADDNLNPPEQGQWLATHFKGKGANVNFRNDNQGFGHFTFSRGEFLQPEHSMIKALLEGLHKAS